MGFIKEIFDEIRKLSFFAIVYEYEQGLYFRKGIVIDKRIKWRGEELENIIKEEKKVIADNVGYLALIRSHFFGKKKPVFPEGYKRSIIGLPKHPKRFKKKKVLEAGFYFNIPIIDEIVTRYQQEKVLNLGNISVPTTDEDSKNVTVSCNIRYELLDLYRAYTAVYDYEATLKDYTIAMLAKHSRGKKYDEWKNPNTVEKLEEIIREDLKKRATDKWGLKIHEVYITDNVSCVIQRLMHEGVSADYKIPIETLQPVNI